MKGSLRHIPWAGQLLILIGIYLISESVFGELAVIIIGTFYPSLDFISFADSFSKIQSVTDITPDQINALKIYQSVTSIGRFMLTAFCFIYLCGDPLIKTLRLNKKIPLQAAVIIFILVMAVASIINVVDDWNKQMVLPASMHEIEVQMRAMENSAKLQTDLFLSTTTLSGLLLNLLIIALVAAAAEEIFFRGLIQGFLQRATGKPHLAIWIAAFFFSFIHFQFYGFFPRLLLGGLIGYLYYWSGSLWSSILAHFINNAASVLAIFLIHTGRMENNIAEESSWQAALISIPFVILLLIAYKRTVSNNSQDHGERLDDGVLNGG